MTHSAAPADKGQSMVPGVDGRVLIFGHGHALRILAARFKGGEGDLTALYFETEEGRGAYYRPDGSPMERSFLAAPVKYERVSSTFTISPGDAPPS